ncbi:MAG: hypothetical protein IJE89_05630 [Bacilli bacterium]|nr:hypothetical protein [Bacilli bacterium]
MEEKLIGKLYQMVIEKKELTYENLIEEGFSNEDISLLISNRIIRLIGDNLYQLYKVDRFHQYGIKLLIQGKNIEATKCFKICHKLMPNGRRINLQMLILEVIYENYEGAYRIYETIENNSIPKNTLDNNLYLYLLNLLCPIKKYSDRVRDFMHGDIVFESATCNKDENQIREAIFKSKFVYARKLVNDLISKKIPEYSIKNELIKVLLNKVIEHERNYKNKLLKLAQEEQYSVINKMLLERANTKRLSKLENYILLVSGTIIEILKTKKIPEKREIVTYDMYKALISNNFKLAQEINDDHHTILGTNKEDDVLHILLIKINEIIKQIELSYEEERKIELDKQIMSSEELAYYIKSENISLEDASKKLGIIKEQMIMIRLVYIRDYYVLGDIELADKLLEEIETKEKITPLIRLFIDKIKTYKEIKTEIKVRKRIKENNEGEN